MSKFDFEYTDHRNTEDQSSNIRQVWYNRYTRVLAVQFRRGDYKVYGYRDVPVGEWESLMLEANDREYGSVGSYYTRNIKGKFPGFMVDSFYFRKVSYTPEQKIADIQAEADLLTFVVSGNRPVVKTERFTETVKAKTIAEALALVTESNEDAVVDSVTIHGTTL